MLSTVTFNGICVKTNQDRHIIAKDILVLRMLTSMFLSSASNGLPTLICKRIKGQKDPRVLKAFFRRRKAKLTLLWGVRESTFEFK